MEITKLGIDLAKNIFQLHGVDDRGKAVLKRKLKRSELGTFTAQLPICEISMEACGGSQYWARKFISQGHSVKIIAAQHVKPFKLSTQKNDSIDAAAIVTAASHPAMKFVAVKELWQQDLQSMHRLRQHLVDVRTATVNQCRGLLMEYGLVIDEGIRNFFSEVPLMLEDGENELTLTIRDVVSRLYKMALQLREEGDELTKKIHSVSQAQEDYRRLLEVPGVGPLVASMFVSGVGNPGVFKNGRHLAAWLGLVPRQSSSGGKEKLLGITKAGDQQLRTVMIHGARALILATIRKQKTDPQSEWILNLFERKGWNITAVALANRNCRIMWHLMKYKEEYKKEYKMAV
jgi:transposase